MDDLDETRRALDALQAALKARDISAHIELTTRWGGTSGGPMKEWKVPSLKLDGTWSGLPDRVVAPTWQPVYMWGYTTWPVDDPDGIADEIKRCNVERARP